VGRRRAPDIQDHTTWRPNYRKYGTNNFAGFTDTHVVPKTIHEFMTMYEICKSPAIMAYATSCRKSKIAANQSEYETYNQNSNGYHYVFGVNLSSSGTSDFVGRWCVLEIKDDSQITGFAVFFARDSIYAKRAYAIAIPSFQLGTVTLSGWLAGWLVGGKSCLSRVACQYVCAINRSASGFPNAVVFCCVYALTSSVRLFVRLSVCHTGDSCKNG